MMHPIEIREQHANLLAEIQELLGFCQDLMLVVTGGAPQEQLNSVRGNMIHCCERIGNIAARIGR